MGNWIDLIIAICGAVSVIVPLAIKLYTTTKQLVQEKNYTKIISGIAEIAKEAEGLFDNGTERREYVLNILKVTSDNLGVPYDEVRFDKELTKIVEAAKKINSK